MKQIDTLKEALKLSPDNAPLILTLANAYLEEFQVEEALPLYEKVLQLNQDDAPALFGKIQCLFLNGKISEAIVRAESIVERFPGEPRYRIFLSRMLLGEGQKEAAKEHYLKAKQLDGKLQDIALEKELFLEGGTTSDKKKEPPQKVAVTDHGWKAPKAFGEPDDDDEEEFDDEEEESGAIEDFMMEQPDTAFRDVGGMESVKEEIRMKIIYPMKNPDLFKAYGKKMGGGVLLYGPPGCGKTLISRATAGEINANFFSVGIHQILDMWMGNSEKNLHQLFELAREHAPSILFFDEVDALAADRSHLKHSSGRTLINQFLAEMDGNNSENEGILVLGATNAPWHLDPAFRRPGRFDRVLFVPPPDEKARAAVINVLGRDKPIEGLDAAMLAKKTEGFSGADLKSIFDIALERSLAQALKAGRMIPVKMSDLLKICKEIKPTTKAWFDSARNYALYSNQGGFYDDVLAFLGIKK